MEQVLHLNTHERHRNNFDAMRLLAALCVLLSHQYALSNRPSPDTLHVYSLGSLGVTMFFAMSGFLVAQSWHADPHVGRFAVKRMLRIWPGLAVAVTLCAVVLGPLVSTLPIREYFADPHFIKYFNNLRFRFNDELPLIFTGNLFVTSINGSLWTIPLELKCYVALGLLGAAGLLRQRWVVLGVMLAVLAIYAVADPRGELMGELLGWTLFDKYPFEHGLSFFMGSMIYAFKLHESHRKVWYLLLACWVLAGTALALGRPLLALWLVVPITVLTVGTTSTPFLRRAGRFGDLSYGIYIYAFPIQQTMIWLFKNRLSWTTILGLTLVVTLALAFASWHLVEKRALRFKPGAKLPVTARPAELILSRD